MKAIVTVPYADFEKARNLIEHVQHHLADTISYLDEVQRTRPQDDPLKMVALATIQKLMHAQNNNTGAMYQLFYAEEEREVENLVHFHAEEHTKP